MTISNAAHAAGSGTKIGAPTEVVAAIGATVVAWQKRQRVKRNTYVKTGASHRTQSADDCIVRC